MTDPKRIRGRVSSVESSNTGVIELCWYSPLVMWSLPEETLHDTLNMRARLFQQHILVMTPPCPSISSYCHYTMPPLFDNFDKIRFAGHIHPTPHSNVTQH